MISSSLLKIGDVFKVTSGGTPSRKRPEYFVGGTIPWVKTGDLKGRYVKKPEEFITEEALKNSSAKIFPKDTVLLAMYGATIGACSILPFEAATNQACGAILPSKRCYPTYLFYYLKSIKELLIKRGVGGAQPNISGSIIKDTQIPLPALPQQKKIAAILDTADAFRQDTKALIAKYEELAQSLFLEMFGDPVVNPMGWEKMPFEHFARFDTRMTTDFDTYADYPHIGIGNIESGTGKIIDFKLVKDENLTSGKYVFGPKHIIYSKIRPNLNKVALPEFDGLCSADSYPLLIEKQNSNKIFFTYLLRSDAFIDFILKHSSRTNIPKANKKQMKLFFGIAPPLSLQHQFAERIQAIEAQKALAVESLAKANDLFNNLLQKAFKGELTSTP